MSNARNQLIDFIENDFVEEFVTSHSTGNFTMLKRI